MEHLETLSRRVVGNSLRDEAFWSADQGARFRRTAVGDGMTDAESYVSSLRAAYPGMPVFLETISNSSRSIPYLSLEYLIDVTSVTSSC